ncbi:MAG: hypothetical protein ACFE0I_00440 [Elainellaceae cyanobacterium]
MTTNPPDRLDILIEQVGHLTEGLIEIKLMIREQTELVREQAETAKQQANSITTLSRDVSRLVGVVDRQSILVDRLLGAARD